jgi:hypothetical protein
MIVMMNLENAERCDLYSCICIVVGVLNVPSYFENENENQNQNESRDVCVDLQSLDY